MNAWSALFVFLAFSNIVTGRVLREDLLKTVQNVLSSKSMVQFLSDPKSRSGAADCDLDVERFLSALYRGELWAVKVLDSSSYFITGILNGNSAGLGNYDECFLATPPGEQNKYFPLYSLVEIVLEQNKNTTKIANKNFAFDFLTTQNHTSTQKAQEENNSDETEAWSPLLTLELGICWIRSCGASAPGKAVAAILSPANAVLSPGGFRLTVAPPRPGAEDIGLPPKIGAASWIFLIICVTIALLALIGTLFDLDMLNEPARRRNPGWKAGFLAFSVYTNGRRLISVGPASSEALTAIGGLRVFSILWVMLGHRYGYMAEVPVVNKAAILEETKNWTKQIITGGVLSVDTFFTIGGILNCYVFCTTMRKGRGFNVPLFFIHRYIRLTPAFALMIGFNATWLYFVASGPHWITAAGKARDDCQNYWWTSLLYLSNYINPNNQCVSQTWYLMVDMQLHWLSLLVLIPLWRWRKIGIAWLLFLVAVSCAVPFAISYIYEYRTPLPTQAFTQPGVIDTTMRNFYFPVHTRATSYLVGVLFGYYLYRARFVIRGYRLGLITVLGGWTASTALALTAIFSAYPLYQFDQDVSLWYSSFYIGFYRLGWSIAVGWIVLACGLGYGGPVNSFLSWDPFVVLGRLVYGMYLTHYSLQLANTMSERVPEHYSDFGMVHRTMSDFVLSMCFGAILCLASESPIGALEKMLLYRPPREDKAAPSIESPEPRISSVSAGVDNPAVDVVTNGENREQTQ